MSKVHFDSEGVKTEVLSHLDDSVIEIGTAKSIASNLNIPDFAYSSYLKDIPQKLSDISRDCNNDITWLNTCVSNYVKFTDDNSEDVNKCLVSEVPLKDYHVGAE